jgi:oxygen-dependent protoporphyrinogen oxidase
LFLLAPRRRRFAPQITFSDPSTQPLHTSHVISTIPPRKLSSLLTTSPLPHLTHNPSTTVGVVNLVFPVPPSKIHPPGFGYLIPRSSTGNEEGVLGVVFDSTSVEGLERPEVAKAITKLTVMIGGPHWSTYRPNPSLNATDVPTPDQLTEIALRHLSKVFPIPEPILVRSQIHRDCIPTYLVGHGARMRELHEAINAGAWAGRLSLAGSGYGGVGVNDCVGMGWEVARGVADGEAVTGLERWADWE